MKKFLKILSAFIVINIAILIVLNMFVLTKTDKYNYDVWETDSNLFIIPKNKSFDLIIMGGSFARMFSRYGNHSKIEKILGKEVINLGKGHGWTGNLQQQIYLSYFYERKNKAKKIVYFVDPWALYSKVLNEDNIVCFNDEPFTIPFALTLLKTDMDRRSIINYFRSKFNGNWEITRNPPYLSTNRVTRIDYALVQRDLKEFSPDGFNQESFDRQSKKLTEIIEMAKKNNTEIILVVPSKLVNDTPGVKQLRDLLTGLENKYNIKVYDYSKEIKDYKLFSDWKHLNSDGVLFFTEHYLTQILEE